MEVEYVAATHTKLDGYQCKLSPPRMQVIQESDELHQEVPESKRLKQTVEVETSEETRHDDLVMEVECDTTSSRHDELQYTINIQELETYVGLSSVY